MTDITNKGLGSENSNPSIKKPIAQQDMGTLGQKGGQAQKDGHGHHLTNDDKSQESKKISS